MRYITSLNKNICESKIKKFVKSCELVFNINISKVANDITNNRNIKFLLIAGPSSSGKTTTTKRLSLYLTSQGFDPISISVDDYFLEREETPKDEFGEYDFECLTAIDLDLFNKDLNDLINGKEINMPSYNFIQMLIKVSSDMPLGKYNTTITVFSVLTVIFACASGLILKRKEA